MATFTSYPISADSAAFCRRCPIIHIDNLSNEEILDSISITFNKIVISKAFTEIKIVLFSTIPNGWSFEEVSIDGIAYKYIRATSSGASSGLFDLNYDNYTNLITPLATFTWSAPINNTGTISWGPFDLPLSNLGITVDKLGTYGSKKGLAVLITTDYDTKANIGSSASSASVKMSKSGSLSISGSTLTKPSGTARITSFYASKNGTKITEPIGGKHDLFVAWSYSSSDATKYSLRIVESNSENAVFSAEISSTNYTVPSSYLSGGKTYYAFVVPINAAGQGTASDESAEITFYNYYLQSIPSSISYKDSSGNIISATTTSKTIITSWNDAIVYNSGGSTTSYPVYYYLSNSNSNSWSTNTSKTFSNLVAGSSITFYELRIAIYDKNTDSYIEIGSYNFTDKTISIIAATTVTGPTITKTLTQNGNIYKATVTFNISSNEATGATLKCYTGGSYETPLNAIIQNKTVAFTFYYPGKTVTKLKFSLNGLSFSYNGTSTTEAEILITSIIFPSSWGVTAPSASELINSVLQKTLTITAGQFDNPIDKKHTIKLILSQNGKTDQILYNGFLTSGIIYSLARGNSVFSYFSENTNITLKYEITNVDSNYNLNDSSSILSAGSIITFQIVPAVTFTATIEDVNLEIYNLNTWKTSGEFSSNTKKINFTINIPEGVPEGGEESYSITYATNNLSISEKIIKTQKTTTIGRATITVNGKYSVGDTEYLNDTQELYLTIVDNRPPYIPSNLTFLIEDSVNNYYIPNYSSSTIGNLENIKLKDNTTIKEISFHFCLNGETQGQASILTGIPSSNSYVYPKDNIPLDIFYNNESKKTIGMLITVIDSNGNSSNRLLSSTIHPAYIPLPSFYTAKITNEQKDGDENAQAYISYTYIIPSNSTIKDDIKLKIQETAVLYDTSTGKQVGNILTQESVYETGEISYEGSFETTQPALGYGVITLQVHYNEIPIFTTITKKVGFQTAVGEIAIRKQQVGILTEPADNSIFTIGNNMGVTYFITFVGTTNSPVGRLILSEDGKGEECVLFSAGEWT